MGRKWSLQASRLQPPSQCEEVRQQRVAGRRENRFRMELDPPNRQRSVSQRHERFIVRPRQRNEIRREGRRVDDQRVVSCHGQRRRKPGKQVHPCMLDVAHLAMNRSPLDDATGKCLTHTLVSEADAENRDSPTNDSRKIHTDTGFARSARARGEDDMARSEREGRLDVDRIVAHHDRLLAQFFEVSREIVDE